MNSQTKNFNVLRVFTAVILGAVLILIGFSIWYWACIWLPEKERRAETLRWEQFADKFYAEIEKRNATSSIE